MKGFFSDCLTLEQKIINQVNIWLDNTIVSILIQGIYYGKN